MEQDYILELLAPEESFTVGEDSIDDIKHVTACKLYYEIYWLCTIFSNLKEDVLGDSSSDLTINNLMSLVGRIPYLNEAIEEEGEFLFKEFMKIGALTIDDIQMKIEKNSKNKKRIENVLDDVYDFYVEHLRSMVILDFEYDDETQSEYEIEDDDEFD